MTTWKKTKKRRAQKAQEQKCIDRRQAEYEAHRAAEEAAERRQVEIMEARLRAAREAREAGAKLPEQMEAAQKAGEAHKAENSPPPRPAPLPHRRSLRFMSMLLAPLLLGAAGMDSLPPPPPKDKP